MDHSLAREAVLGKKPKILRSFHDFSVSPAHRTARQHWCFSP